MPFKIQTTPVFRWLLYCGDLNTELVQHLNCQKEVGCQMVLYLNAIWILDSSTIWISNKWIPYCFLSTSPVFKWFVQYIPVLGPTIEIWTLKSFVFKWSVFRSPLYMICNQMFTCFRCFSSWRLGGLTIQRHRLVGRKTCLGQRPSAQATPHPRDENQSLCQRPKFSYQSFQYSVISRFLHLPI